MNPKRVPDRPVPPLGRLVKEHHGFPIFDDPNYPRKICKCGTCRRLRRKYGVYGQEDYLNRKQSER